MGSPYIYLQCDWPCGKIWPIAFNSSVGRCGYCGERPVKVSNEDKFNLQAEEQE
jgi:hypothetical protein